jgi:endonuclease YncB( thermonuclease family)
MRKTAVALWFAPLLLAAGLREAPGDSLYGTVTAVRRSNLVVFNYGDGEYSVRLIGIEVSKSAPIEERARQLVSSLVLKKRTQMRFEYRAKNGDMLGRLLTADSGSTIKDVGVELLRAGLARRQANYDYKYQELSAAENLARRERLGLWANRR